jgi:DNA-binding beta-propeller fold protein YncE
MRKKLTILGACLVLVLAAALLASHLRSSVPRLDYQVVPGWPEWPSDIQFGHVTGVAADRNDHVYVFFNEPLPPGREEPNFGQVAVFDRHGKFLRTFGKQQVKSAHGLRLDGDQNVWVTDIGHHLVMKFSPEGELLLQLGKPDQPGDGPDQFNKPTDIAFAPSGEFYVSDGYGNSRVVKFSKDGKYLKEWGKKGAKPGEFNLPHGICLDPEGRVYVADRLNTRIQIFDSDGQFLTEWRDNDVPLNRDALGWPFGVTFSNDALLVADGARGWITFYRDGQPLGRFGSDGTGPGQFRMAHAVCADSQGAIYVADALFGRVQKFVKK